MPCFGSGVPEALKSHPRDATQLLAAVVAQACVCALDMGHAKLSPNDLHLGTLMLSASHYNQHIPMHHQRYQLHPSAIIVTVPLVHGMEIRIIDFGCACFRMHGRPSAMGGSIVTELGLCADAPYTNDAITLALDVYVRHPRLVRRIRAAEISIGDSWDLAFLKDYFHLCFDRPEIEIPVDQLFVPATLREACTKSGVHFKDHNRSLASLRGRYHTIRALCLGGDSPARVGAECLVNLLARHFPHRDVGGPGS